MELDPSIKEALLSKIYKVEQPTVEAKKAADTSSSTKASAVEMEKPLLKSGGMNKVQTGKAYGGNTLPDDKHISSAQNKTMAARLMKSLGNASGRPRFNPPNDPQAALRQYRDSDKYTRRARDEIQSGGESVEIEVESSESEVDQIQVLRDELKNEGLSSNVKTKNYENPGLQKLENKLIELELRSLLLAFKPVKGNSSAFGEENAAIKQETLTILEQVKQMPIPNEEKIKFLDGMQEKSMLRSHIPKNEYTAIYNDPSSSEVSSETASTSVETAGEEVDIETESSESDGDQIQALRDELQNEGLTSNVKTKNYENPGLQRLENKLIELELKATLLFLKPLQEKSSDIKTLEKEVLKILEKVKEMPVSNEEKIKFLDGMEEKSMLRSYLPKEEYREIYNELLSEISSAKQKPAAEDFVTVLENMKSANNQEELETLRRENRNTPHEVATGYKSVMTTKELFESLTNVYTNGNAEEKAKCKDFYLEWINTGMYAHEYNDPAVLAFSSVATKDLGVTDKYRLSIVEAKVKTNTPSAIPDNRPEIKSLSQLGTDPKKIANEFRSFFSELETKVTIENTLSFERDEKAKTENPNDLEAPYWNNGILNLQDSGSGLKAHILQDILRSTNRNEAKDKVKIYLKVAEEALKSGDGATLFTLDRVFDDLKGLDLIPSKHLTGTDYPKILARLKQSMSFTNNWGAARELAKNHPDAPQHLGIWGLDINYNSEKFPPIKNNEINATRMRVIGKANEERHVRQEKMKENISGKVNIKPLLQEFINEDDLNSRLQELKGGWKPYREEI